MAGKTKADTKKRGGARDAGATRERLLQAAVEVFAETGYAGATTRVIAERAGVNEVTLFRHFGAKADLLVQAMAGEADRLLPQAFQYSGDLETDFVRLVRHYVEFVAGKARFIATVLSELPRFPELAPAAEVPRRMFAAAAGVIGRYQKEGALRPEPPHIVAGTLLAPLLMLAIGKTAGLVPSAEVSPEEYVRGFLSGHAVPRGQSAAPGKASSKA